jgi:hypothetical protein
LSLPFARSALLTRIQAHTQRATAGFVAAAKGIFVSIGAGLVSMASVMVVFLI